MIDFRAGDDQMAESTDRTTGLADWQAGLRALARSRDEPFIDLVLVVADVRDFRRINTRHGMAVGNAYLRTIAERIASVAGPGSTCRFGADLFLIAIRAVDLAAVEAFADRLRDAVERPIAGEEAGLWLGAAFARPGEALNDVYLAADRACWDVKGEIPQSGIAIAPDRD